MTTHVQGFPKKILGIVIGRGLDGICSIHMNVEGMVGGEGEGEAGLLC